MGYWSVWRPLACVTLSILEPHGNSSWIFYCCPTSWGSCCFGSTVLALLCDPADDRLGKCWYEPPQNPILEWEVGDLIIQPELLCPHYNSRLYRTSPGGLPNAAANKEKNHVD